MALSFPNRDLLDTVRFRQQSFRLVPRQELSRQAGGIVRSKTLGPSLWAASFTTVPMLWPVAAGIEALLDSLDGAANPFIVYDWRAPYPAAYPTGSFTDSGAIASVPTATSLSLKSLPAGFAITRGDKFYFTASNQRRSLHRAMESVTADGSGTTAVFDVRPVLPSYATVDRAVGFKKPSCKMVLEPGSVETTTEDDFTTISFSAIQTY